MVLLNSNEFIIYGDVERISGNDLFVRYMAYELEKELTKVS